MILPNIYLFKVKNINAKKRWRNKVNNKDTREMVNDIVLASLLLTLNKFHTFFYCFCNRISLNVDLFERTLEKEEIKRDTSCLNLFVFLESFVELRIPACNYIFKIHNRNTRAKCEICSDLTIKTPEPRHKGASF